MWRKIFLGLGSILFALGIAPLLIWGFDLPEKPFVVDEQTISLWHFDEGEGNFVKDATGRNDLSLAGNYAWAKRGIFGTCLELNGKDSYAVIDKPIQKGLIKIETPFTVEAWVKIKTFPETHWGSRDIVGRFGAEGDTRAYSLNILRIGPNKVVARFLISYDGTARNWYEERVGIADVFGNTNLTTDSWYHIAGVYEPGFSLRIYVNGKLDGMKQDVPDAVYSGEAFFTVGTIQRGEKFFHGLIDEVRISKTARYE